jgi:cob(I)alamin adenosyltransferase
VEKGQTHIYTGDGKGKTTAAMGLAFRASAYDKKIYILQFLKGKKTGERMTSERFDNITFKRANDSDKFIFQMNESEKEELIKEAQQIWDEVVEVINKSDYEIIILDEIMGAISNNMVGTEQVADLIKSKNNDKELILTGRNAPEKLIKLADYVSEMKLVKHPFNDDIPAREAIEY